MAVFIKKVNIPQKSDLINIDMTGSGTAQTYRIIKKISDDVVEVVAMWQTERMKAGNTNTYDNSTLDTYLNTTWYNTLSNTAKLAIVDKTFRQESWYPSNRGNPVYIKKASNISEFSLGSSSFGNEITRHVYALGVQDLIDYVEATPEMTSSNTTFTVSNILTMLYNDSSYIGDALWLNSASAYNQSYFMTVVYTEVVGSTMGSLTISRAKPAFQIDLSKIDYTFTDGRQPVELKSVSILQKSNNALSRVGMSWKIPEPMTSVSVSNASTTYYIAPALDMRLTTSSFVVNGGTQYDAYYYASSHKPTTSSESWEVPFSLKLNEALAGSFEIAIREDSNADMHSSSAFATRFSVVVLKNGEVAKTITDTYYPTVTSTDFTTQAGDILTFQITATYV